MSATRMREAWEAGPPDDPRFSDPGPQREHLPAVQNDQLTAAIAKGAGDRMVQLIAPDPLPAQPSAKVAQRIAAVMSEVERVEKKGWNDFHKFAYASIDDIRALLARLCGKHGLAWRQTELRTFPVGAKLIGVTYLFTLSAVDEPETEAFPTIITTLATLVTSKGGLDDKAFSKARALAWKDWAKGQFAIPTGDDEDPDASEPAPPRRNGKPADRKQDRNGADEKPLQPGGFVDAQGRVHWAKDADAWQSDWRKRIRAFDMADNMPGLRDVLDRNIRYIEASGDAGQEIKHEIQLILNPAAASAPPLDPGDEADRGAGAADDSSKGDYREPLDTVDDPAAKTVKTPPVAKARQPDRWVANFTAAVEKCPDLETLDALVVRERTTIDVMQSQHEDLYSTLQRAIIGRRSALEKAEKAASGGGK